MKRLILSIAASLAGFITMSAQTVWDGSVAESFAAGDGSAEAPYEIATPSQLAYLASIVNNGDKCDGMFFIQTADIDLNGSEELQWTPIANRYNIYFGGSYDGQNHTISNLYINDTADTATNNCGLFGNCNDKSRISRLVINGRICTKKGMAGMAVSSSGKISDCISLLEVNISDSGQGAGIVQNNRGTIDRCIFAGKAFGGFMTGGIAGNNTGTIRECLNLGLMEGNPEANSPMIAGIAASNSGTVADCINAGSVYGYNRTGGIAAHQSGTISDCLNYGPVFGYGCCGAILGYGTGTPNLYYDVQTASGLLTGEEYYGQGNLRIPTATFISGEQGNMAFTDASKFSFEKGAYPQLTAFKSAANTLARQLSALAAVPVTSPKNEVWAALCSDLTVQSSISVGDKAEQLNWVSETPETISFNGTTAQFSETGKDSDIRFYAELEGSGLRKHFLHHRYEVFRTIEEPEYSIEGKTKRYKMESIGNFAWVAALTNGLKLVFSGDDAAPEYSNFQDCVLDMAGDIDFAGHNWVPIAGCGSPTRHFAGKLYGNGHAIKNLTIDRKTDENMALFATMKGENSGISNLRMAGGSVKSTGESTASMIGYLHLGDLEDCINESCQVSGNYIAGGLAAKVRGVNIIRCANMANVNSASFYAGGIVNSFNSDDNKYSVIDQCFNIGNINSKSGYSGGLTALTGTYSTISHSYNKGEITADGDYIGGITSSTAPDASVTNCYNAGLVKKPKGFLGDVHVGEIAGTDGGGNFSKNFYDATTGVAGGGIAGNDRIGVTGMTTEEIKSTQTIEKLGNEFFAQDSYGINDGYPTLVWQNMLAGIDIPSTEATDYAIAYDASTQTLKSALDHAAEVYVYGTDGHVARKASIAVYGETDLSGLPQGMYIAVAYARDGQTESVKFITK